MRTASCGKDTQAGNWTHALARALGFCLLLGMTTSCGPNLVKREQMKQALIKKATAEISCVSEFHKYWPDSRIDLFSRNFQKGTTVIQVSGVAYDRYEVSLTIPTEVDTRTLSIEACGAPQVFVHEITAISRNGQTEQVTYKYGQTFRITPQAWDSIVKAGGAIAAAGIAIKTNDPVPGIELLQASVRAELNPK